MTITFSLVLGVAVLTLVVEHVCRFTLRRLYNTTSTLVANFKSRRRWKRNQEAAEAYAYFLKTYEHELSLELELLQKLSLKELNRRNIDLEVARQLLIDKSFRDEINIVKAGKQSKNKEVVHGVVRRHAERLGVNLKGSSADY